MPPLSLVLSLAVPWLAGGNAAPSVAVCPSVLAAGQTHHCFVTGTVQGVALMDGQLTIQGQPVGASMYSISLPADLAHGSYTVQTTPCCGAQAQTANVTVTGEAAVMLLEADKAKYKPGQTALFRALALSPSLRLPVAGLALEFAIVSPQGFKLLQVSGTTDTAGVARFEFPIATEPLQGRHVARVSAMGTNGSQSAGVSHEIGFDIEEYVLPRFEVNVTVDQTHISGPTWQSSGTETITVSGRLAAEYTFGEPVVGTAVVTAFGQLIVQHFRGGIAGGARVAADAGAGAGSGQGGPMYEPLAMVESVQLSAEGANFQLSIQRSRLVPGSNLVVEASVVDVATRERQNGTGTVPVTYAGSELSVAVATADGSDVFKPRLPLSMRVDLQLAGGAPAGTDDISTGGPFRLVMERQLVDRTRTAPARAVSELGAASFSGGSVQVDLAPLEEDPNCCDPLATVSTEQEYLDRKGCCTSAVTVYVERGLNGSGQRLWNSPDGANPSLCLPRAYSPTGEFLAVIPPVAPATGATLRSTLSLSQLQASAEYMVLQEGALVGAGQAALASASSASGYAELTLPVQIPSTAAGGCRLVVVARTATQGSVTGSASFSRSLSWPLSLSASWSMSEVEPGAALSINVQADPVNATAHAFLASLDRSAELLGQRSAINSASVLAALGRAGRGASATPVAPRVWRECHFHGRDAPIIGDLDAGVTLLLSNTSSTGDSSLDQPWGRSLNHLCPRPITGNCQGGGGGPVIDIALAEADGAVQRSGNSAASAGAGGASGQAVPVRRFFPETWVWTDIALAASAAGTPASASHSVTAPDTITTWSLEAFVTTPEGIAATRSATPLRVFKPFFAEVRLPYSAIRGEDLEVSIGVFNYIEASGSVSASLTVTLPSGLELVEGSLSPQLAVPQGSAASAIIRVRPTILGTLRILVQASAAGGGAAHADAIERALLVKPEGFQVVETTNVVVELTQQNPSVSNTITMPLPARVINDSARASVSVVGDLLGPTISGLEGLLRIPTGCGEQNMISLAPNVYVGKYLAAAGRLRPELRQRIARNMLVGYGRELTYRHGDGSFSAFGEQDGSGSTWLTAFVLRTFAEVHALGFITVDTSVLESATTWLIQQQQQDGSFASVGKVIHQEMMGGLGGGGSNAALTAYVLGALAKAQSEASLQVTGLQDALDRARTLLQGTAASGTYLGLLREHALLLANLQQPGAAADAVLQLSQTAGARRYWTAGSSSSMDVELTGYGVLVLSLANRLDKAFEGARWLLERRSASGGFSSTQNTVVALNALATYATAVAGNAQVSVAVTGGGGIDHAFQVQASNFDVMQTQAQPTPGVPVSLTATGTGVALVVAELAYNVPEQQAEPCYEVDVQWFEATAGGGSVRGCARPRPACTDRASEGMWIMDVGLFTGFNVAAESLLQQRSLGRVKRFEMQDGRVLLYLEDLSPDQATCIDFGVTQDFNVRGRQPAASTVYEYYAPERSGGVLTAFEMRPAPDAPATSASARAWLSASALWVAAAVASLGR